MKFYLDNIKSSKITPSKKRTNRATPIKLLLACVGVVIAGIVITPLLEKLSYALLEPYLQNEHLEEANAEPEKLNYEQLKTDLQNKQWEEANAENDRLILKAAGESNALNVQSAQNIPCESLQTIDKLWTENSDGRFGYTPQLKAYEETGNKFNQYHEGNYEAFGNRVGWRFMDLAWKKYQDFNYTALAPRGQLPTPVRKDVDRQVLREREPEMILSRFYDCGF